MVVTVAPEICPAPPPRRYRSFTSATISPPWTISAPNSHFRRSTFIASIRASTLAMSARVSWRSVSMPASILAMPALISWRSASMPTSIRAASAVVARLALSRATCSSARVSACFSVEPLSVQALHEAVSIERDGLGHAPMIGTVRTLDKDDRALP